jgi:hypothetical protein
MEQYYEEKLKLHETIVALMMLTYNLQRFTETENWLNK